MGRSKRTKEDRWTRKTEEGERPDAGNLIRIKDRRSWRKEEEEEKGYEIQRRRKKVDKRQERATR